MHEEHSEVVTSEILILSEKVLLSGWPPSKTFRLCLAAKGITAHSLRKNSFKVTSRNIHIWKHFSHNQKLWLYMYVKISKVWHTHSATFYVDVIELKSTRSSLIRKQKIVIWWYETKIRKFGLHAQFKTNTPHDPKNIIPMVVAPSSPRLLFFSGNRISCPELMVNDVLD